MFNILLSIFAFLLTSNVFACRVSTPKDLSIAISTNDQTYFSYQAKSVNEQIKNTEISNCTETANKRKFLMLAMGPEIVDGSDTARGTNFNGEYKKSSCDVINNPLNLTLTETEKENIFKSRWNFIRNCVEIHVSENGRSNLSAPENQEGCKLQFLNNKSAFFKGGYCFFKPAQDSNYIISYQISKECQNSDFYRSGIDLQELTANISFYTSSNFKDDLNDLTGIGTMPLRISINPIKEVLTPSDDFGILRPTFPSDYPMSDLHLGKISFTKVSDTFIVLKTPFVVDNFCHKTLSKNGLSTSACHYATPIASMIELKDETGTVLLNWMDGGVAPANWQGIIEGEGIQFHSGTLLPNKMYTLEYVFTDPYYDFNLLKNINRSKIGLINTKLPTFDRDGKLKEIDEVKTISILDEMLELNPIDEIDFSKRLLGLSAQRKRLNNYFSTSMWPPMYERVCNPTTSKCKKNEKEYIKFIAKFRLDNELNISELNVKRESTLFAGYNKTIEKQPEYQCN